MSERPERRRVPRLMVPRHLRGDALEHHEMHVVDLNPLGARIATREPQHEGVVCYVDLPPTLGAVRLTGRVVWTRIRGTEQTLAGDRWSLFESGIEFTGPTSEQRTALAAVLETLQATLGASERETR